MTLKWMNPDSSTAFDNLPVIVYRFELKPELSGAEHDQ